MDHVGSVIKGNSEYVLLDEQLVVYDKVLARARRGFHDRKTTVLLVRGGPGTGKSVIALNLMADLCSRATTPTTPPARGLHRDPAQDHRARGAIQFKYFNSYRTPRPTRRCPDLRRVAPDPRDEPQPLHAQGRAHGLPQIGELLDAARSASSSSTTSRSSARARSAPPPTSARRPRSAAARCSSTSSRPSSAVPARTPSSTG